MAQLQPRPLISLPTAKISTGDAQLDHVLGGGLPCGSLTEVTGEAAASKTQLCLQLLLSVQLPQAYGGLGGCGVYVYTEGSPAMQRLHQLAKALPLRYPPEALAGLPDLAANIFVEKGVANGTELLQRLQRLRGLLDQQRRRAQAAASSAAGSSISTGGTGGSSSLSGRPVRLLVVDSVAHVFRDLGEGRPGGAGVGELAGRTQLLFKISALLRRYADEYGLAILLVNQVVDSLDNAGDSGGATRSSMLPAAQQQPTKPAAKNMGHTGGLRLVSLGREVVPALGLAWANCINTRLFLSRCHAPDGPGPALFYGTPSPASVAAAAVVAGKGGGGGGGALAPALRKLQVVFAPHLPRGSECHYIVEATGVRGLHPEELEQHDAAVVAAAAAAAAAQQQQQQAWEQEQRQRWAWEQQQGQGWHQQQHGWPQRPQQAQGRQGPMPQQGGGGQWQGPLLQQQQQQWPQTHQQQWPQTHQQQQGGPPGCQPHSNSWQLAPPCRPLQEQQPHGW